MFSVSLAALAIEFAFQALGVVPTHQAQVVEASLQLNYTTILNVLLLGLASLLLWRFFTTGGPEMLSHMNRAAPAEGMRTVSGVAIEGTQYSHKYACPMHPDVIEDQPGKCPKCGMRLNRIN